MLDFCFNHFHLNFDYDIRYVQKYTLFLNLWIKCNEIIFFILKYALSLVEKKIVRYWSGKCNGHFISVFVSQIVLLALAVIASASLVDIIPHYSYHGYGHGVSARYFRKAQGHGYGLGNGGYGLGYGGYGLGYGGLGLGAGLGYGAYGLGYGGYY